MAFRVSKPNLLALCVLFGCSSPEFTNVHHRAAGGATSAAAGSAPYGGAGGHGSLTGGSNLGSGAADTKANAGQATAGNGSVAGASPSTAGTSSQAGANGTGSAGTPFSNDAGKSGLGGNVGAGEGNAGAAAAATGQNGGAPALGGMSGTAGGGAVSAAGGAGEPIGGCNHQLLANADFEAGPGSPWQESSDWPGIEIVVAATDPSLQSEGVAPYAGNYLAWLGGIPDNPYDHYEVTLTQDITIPAGTAELTLTGEYLIHSQDGQDGAYDEAHIQLNVGDNLGWLAESWTNQDMSHGWQSFTAQTTDLDGLRGKTVTFIAYSRTDLDGKTSFWLDDLRLQATCGR